MGDDVASLYLRILERRVTIAISQILHIEVNKLLLNGVIAIYLPDDILHFDAVCSDVLNRRRAHLSRNIRKVLHTPEALLGRPGAEIVEDDSGADRDQNWRKRFLGFAHASLGMTSRRFIQNFDEVDFGMEDCTLEIVCKKQIAAAADVQHRSCKLLKLDVHKISHRIILNETTSLHLHPESVKTRHILVIGSFNHISYLTISPYLYLCLPSSAIPFPITLNDEGSASSMATPR